MNNLLVSRFRQLSSSAREGLKKTYEASPKMIRLIKMLEKPGKKLGVKEAVEYIYSDEPEDFTVLRNRFFKLRKKLLEEFEKPETSAIESVKLMPMESELFRCRELVSMNDYPSAKEQLQKLKKACWEKNVFELLPDVLHQLIFCNLALNKFNENERLHKELAASNELLFDLNRQRQLARQVYQKIVERHDVEQTTKLLKQHKKIADKNKTYPRFTLYYHFIVASHGAMILNDPKAIRKSFDKVRSISTTYPEMPVAFYEPYGKEMLRFYVTYGEGMNSFQEGDTFAAYQDLMEAWKIMEEVPGLRSKKTESNYSNKIAIELATRRYTDALQTANELLEFLIDQKEEEKKLKAYTEIVQIYTYAFPLLQAPDAEFLIKKHNAFIKTISPDNTFAYFGQLLNKAVFLFQHKELKAALKVIDQKGMNEFLATFRLSYYSEMIRLYESGDVKKIKHLLTDLEKTLQSESRPDIVFPMQRAVSTIRGLIKDPT